MSQPRAHSFEISSANILLQMPEKGRETHVTQNAALFKMSSRKQSYSHQPRGPSGHGGSYTTEAPTKPRLPRPHNSYSVLCHVGGQKPDDTVAPLFTLLLS